MSKIHQNDTFADYLGNPAYGSSAVATVGHKSIKHLLAEDNKETQSQSIGTAFHCLALEGADVFNETYSILDLSKRPETDKTMASKANKEWKESLEASGKELLTVEDMLKITDMFTSCKMNKAISTILWDNQDEVVRELSHYLTVDGVDIKLRPDMLNFTKKYIVSVKTADNVSPDGFGKAIVNENYNYHTKESFYLDMLNEFYGADTFNRIIFIAVQNKAPFDVAVYEFMLNDNPVGRLFTEPIEPFFEIGRHYYKKGLERIKEYLTSGIAKGLEIPTDERGVSSLELPYWYVNQFNFNN